MATDRTPSLLLKNLSRRRQELVRPIFERPQDYVLESARGVAKKLNVHPSTILRTVTGMGSATGDDMEKQGYQIRHTMQLHQKIKGQLERKPSKVGPLFFNNNFI